MKIHPAHVAAKANNLGIFKDLIDSDFSFTRVKDENGNEPIHYTTVSNQIRNLELLLANKVDINAKNGVVLIETEKQFGRLSSFWF